MSKTPIRFFRDGELVEERTVILPDPPELPAVAQLRERLAEVEAEVEQRVTARIAALEQRTTGLDVAAMKSDLATLRERVDRAREQAAAINPNAVEEPGARAEIAKVKDALTPDVPANETEVV